MNEEVLVLGWSDCATALEDVSRAMRKLKSGARLRVIFSNRDFAVDLLAWCHEHGNRMKETGVEGENYFVVVEKT